MNSASFTADRAKHTALIPEYLVLLQISIRHVICVAAQLRTTAKHQQRKILVRHLHWSSNPNAKQSALPAVCHLRSGCYTARLQNSYTAINLSGRTSIISLFE